MENDGDAACWMKWKNPHWTLPYNYRISSNTSWASNTGRGYNERSCNNRGRTLNSSQVSNISRGVVVYILIEFDRSVLSAVFCTSLVCVMKLSIFRLPYFRLPIWTYH